MMGVVSGGRTFPLSEWGHRRRVEGRCGRKRHALIGFRISCDHVCNVV